MRNINNTNSFFHATMICKWRNLKYKLTLFHIMQLLWNIWTGIWMLLAFVEIRSEFSIECKFYIVHVFCDFQLPLLLQNSLNSLYYRGSNMCMSTSPRIRFYGRWNWLMAQILTNEPSTIRFFFRSRVVYQITKQM